MFQRRSPKGLSLLAPMTVVLLLSCSVVEDGSTGFGKSQSGEQTCLAGRECRAEQAVALAKTLDALDRRYCPVVRIGYTSFSIFQGSPGSEPVFRSGFSSALPTEDDGVVDCKGALGRSPAQSLYADLRSAWLQQYSSVPDAKATYKFLGCREKGVPTNNGVLATGASDCPMDELGRFQDPNNVELPNHRVGYNFSVVQTSEGYRHRVEVEAPTGGKVLSFESIENIPKKKIQLVFIPYELSGDGVPLRIAVPDIDKLSDVEPEISSLSSLLEGSATASSLAELQQQWTAYAQGAGKRSLEQTLNVIGFWVSLLALPEALAAVGALRLPKSVGSLAGFVLTSARVVGESALLVSSALRATGTYKKIAEIGDEKTRVSVATMVRAIDLLALGSVASLTSPAKVAAVVDDFLAASRVPQAAISDALWMDKLRRTLRSPEQLSAAASGVRARLGLAVDRHLSEVGKVLKGMMTQSCGV